MANSKISGSNKVYVTVDTDPGSGYFTDPIMVRHIKENVFFSVRETIQDESDPSVMNVLLQFQCPGDIGWQNYNNNAMALVAGDRFNIDDFGAGVLWRAGVIDYTSGALTFGFDW